jgi:hypothetical protein
MFRLSRQSGRNYKNPFTEDNMRRMNYMYSKPGVAIQSLRDKRKQVHGTWSGSPKAPGDKQQASKSGPTYYQNQPLISWRI